MTYLLHPDGTVQPQGQCSFIPPDADNIAYREYLQWLSEGNSPEIVPPYEAGLPPELTPAEKLAAAGLSVDELRTLLGLDP